MYNKSHTNQNQIVIQLCRPFDMSKYIRTDVTMCDTLICVYFSSKVVLLSFLGNSTNVQNKMLQDRRHSYLLRWFILHTSNFHLAFDTERKKHTRALFIIYFRSFAIATTKRTNANRQSQHQVEFLCFISAFMLIQFLSHFGLLFVPYGVSAHSAVFLIISNNR